MNERTKHLLGDSLLLLVAIIWGVGFPVVKVALTEGLSTFSQLSLRFAFASLGLLAWQAGTKKGRRSLKRPATIRRGLILGAFLFLGFSLQTAALVFTTVSKNAFLTGAYVVLVPFVSWLFFRTRVDLKSILAALLAFIGIGMLTLGGGIGGINPGDVLTLVCAVMFSLHIALTAVIARDEPAPALVFYQMLLASVLSAVVAAAAGETPAFTLKGMLAVVYLGLFSSMLAFLLQTIGQKFAHASKSAILLSTESLFGALLGVLLFNEQLTLRMGFGAAIIFSGIVLVETELPSIFTRKPLSR